MHVSYTYWDLDKLFRFYSALNAVLRYEVKEQWLLYVNNPPLFYIRLAYFFRKMQRQLDARSKDISKFTDDLLSFCSKYIETASDDTLMLNLLDKDSKDREFLEYVFIM